jgi:hypothetical protein
MMEDEDQYGLEDDLDTNWSNESDDSDKDENEEEVMIR